MHIGGDIDGSRHRGVVILFSGSVKCLLRSAVLLANISIDVLVSAGENVATFTVVDFGVGADRVGAVTRQHYWWHYGLRLVTPMEMVSISDRWTTVSMPFRAVWFDRW